MTRRLRWLRFRLVRACRDMLCFFFRIACDRPVRIDLAEDIRQIRLAHARAIAAAREADRLIEGSFRRGGHA